MPRPPRLPDADIHAVIDELRVQRGFPTGTALRAELARRFEYRGGVSRIYRLLRDHAHTAATPAPAPPPPPSPAAAPGELQQLRRERDEALRRAHLAELREESHQDRWANEIYDLRQRVRELRDAARRLPIVERSLQDRSRELASAYHRLATLEDELRRLRGD